MKKLLALVMALVLVLGAAAALADYPDKPLNAICPWSAGGGTDNCLRAFCMALEKQLGQTIVVDNRTGASGVTGHEAIADADPDGYTFGMITFELAAYKAQEMSDYDYTNFDPVCRLNTDAAAITVNKAWADANGIADINAFVAYCKEHPGEVKMGGSSAGSVWHIAGGYLMTATGIEIDMITYGDGAAAAVKAAAQGEIQGVTVSLAEARSFIESGDLVCLGVMDTQRNSAEVFKDIPTCQEQGVDAVYATWRCLGLPLGVDEAIRTKFQEACAVAVEDPDFVTFMNNAGQTTSYLDAAATVEFLKQQTADVPSAMEAVGLL